MTRVRELAAAGAYDEPLWRLLCTEMELPSLHVPIEYGGSGGTLVDAAIAFEETGRGLVPLPLAATTFAIQAVLGMGSADQCSRLLPSLISGERIGSLAAVGPDVAEPSTTAVRADGRSDFAVLDGTCSPVLHGAVADLFVVPAWGEDGPGLYVVEADAPGVTVEALPSFDSTRPVARLGLEHARAEALAAASPEGVQRLLDVARVLLAAEMLGGAEACLAMSVEYARTRMQFGRPIGSFQAVKHSCADMMIEIDASRVAVMFAAMSAEDTAELSIAAPLAKAQTADTFALCAGAAIQVHGGIAFTWEHDLHLYYRRAKTTAALFGNSTHHRALLADRAKL